jgi:hypothetical protein
MELGKRTKNFFKTRHARALIAGLMLLSLGVQAASLQTFGTLFQQLTNDLAFLQQNFDGSPGLKLQIALLTRAHGLVLDEDLPDEQALARLVPLLSHDTNYTIVLDDSAFNTRAAILARYDALGERVAALPPWSRATATRTRFANLANEHAALTNAATAAAVASLLPPFVAQLAAVSKYEVRARLMPRPRTRLNSLFAVVDGRRFTSTRGGRNSPNEFEVTASTDFYRDVTVRAVDGAGVIHLNLPVLTEQIRYEVASGLAAISHSPDVFATNVVIMTATNGTVFVQTDRREVYGVFTCDGPGLQIRDGRFRIQLPRALRE